MDRLNLYKYELFFGSQLAILFGTLLIPESIHDYYSTGAFFVNIVAGSLFIGYGESKHNPIIRVIVLALIAIIFLLANSFPSLAQIFNYSKFGILFVFHLVVTAKLINQIWKNCFRVWSFNFKPQTHSG